MLLHKKMERQRTPLSNGSSQKAPRPFVERIGRYSAIALVTVAVFGLGWALGAGKISLGLPSNIQSRNGALPENLDYSSVEQVYDALRQNYDGELKPEDLLNGLKSGLATATKEPYTEYFNEKDAQEFDNELEGTFSGIGAELSKEDGNIVIVSPIAGYPADKAGLKPRDIIVDINDKPASNMTISEAVNAIRGPVGTSVKLRLARDGQEVKVDIKRENISIPSVESSVVGNNLGYIKIIRFSEDTPDLARAAAEKFKQQNVRGIILDMRGNPGGRLEAAVDVSSLWLNSDQTVLSERRGGEIIKTHQASGNPILAGLPTVVLIDEGSASASEITAGALKDNKAATLIGVKSYGKGSVQNLVKLPSGGLLKVTIARWYTPNGRNIDKEGIAPDQKVERTADDFKAKRDPQKDAAMTKLQ